MLISNQHHILVEWKMSFTTSSEAAGIEILALPVGELLISPACSYFFSLSFLGKAERERGDLYKW